MIGLVVMDVKVGCSFPPAQTLTASHFHILAKFPGVLTLMCFTAASSVLSITKQQSFKETLALERAGLGWAGRREVRGAHGHVSTSGGCEGSAGGTRRSKVCEGWQRSLKVVFQIHASVLSTPCHVCTQMCPRSPQGSASSCGDAGRVALNNAKCQSPVRCPSSRQTKIKQTGRERRWVGLFKISI